jgi:hypothetical protein
MSIGAKYSPGPRRRCRSARCALADARQLRACVSEPTSFTSSRHTALSPRYSARGSCRAWRFCSVKVGLLRDANRDGRERLDSLPVQRQPAQSANANSADPRDAPRARRLPSRDCGARREKTRAPEAVGRAGRRSAPIGQSVGQKREAGNSEGLPPARRQTADRREEETGRRAVPATPHARREEDAGLAATRIQNGVPKPVGRAGRLSRTVRTEGGARNQ